MYRIQTTSRPFIKRALMLVDIRPQEQLRPTKRLLHLFYCRPSCHRLLRLHLPSPQWRLGQQQPTQTRSFSRAGGGYSKLRPKKKKTKQNSLKTLGLHVKQDESVAYTTVKQTFLQIAMKHHPDTAHSMTDADFEEHKRIFMEARAAFELLVEAPDGSAILRQDLDAANNTAADDDFNTWFQQETGYDMPFMDAQTMKEVADMTETVGGGLDRDGGMWTLARMVTQNVKNGGDGRDVLRLEAGDVRSRDVNGILRRKRKR